MPKIGDILETRDGFIGKLERIDEIDRQNKNYVLVSLTTGRFSVFPERYIIFETERQCRLGLKEILESEIV